MSIEVRYMCGTLTLYGTCITVSLRQWEKEVPGFVTREFGRSSRLEALLVVVLSRDGIKVYLRN